MNREQRRKYDREVKKRKVITSICPECKHLAAFYTHARGEKDTVLICERCGQIVREGEELTRLMPPGIYSPLPMDKLDKALLFEASRIDKEETDEPVIVNEAAPVEVEGSIA